MKWLENARLLILVVFGLAWFVVSPAHAVTPCPPGKAANVQVHLHDPEPNITAVQSLKQINKKASVHGLRRKGGMILGLTETEVRTELTFQMRVVSSRSDVCMAVESVQAVFGHDKLVVSLPIEYARGTCQYNEVLKHEMAHVNVNREGVRKYSTVLERELKRAVAQLNPVRARTQTQGQQTIDRALRHVMKTVTQRFEQDIQAKHVYIDTPGTPYDANGACRSW